MTDARRHQDGISVVVPAFRSPGTLHRLVEEVEQVLGDLVPTFELIIVDDGSGDDTWDTIQKLAADNSWVRGLSLLRNYGQHNALLAGLRDARLPVVVTIDDDLQNPPREIPLLLEQLTDGVDLVYGRPKSEPQTAGRNVASRMTKRVMSTALGDDVYPRSSAFRVFRRELILASTSVHDPHISIDVLLSWATTRIVDVEVDFDLRTGGQSGYSFSKLVRHAFNMVTGYSTRPLRWVGFVGTVCALAGFAMLTFVLGRYVLGGADVAGFTFLAAAITTFSGVQLLSLGVMGEYIGRMHFRTMGKPPYVVRSQTAVARTRAEDPDPTEPSASIEA